MQNCPSCQVGKLHVVEEVRTFTPPTEPNGIYVRLFSSVCEQCGAKVTTRDQRLVNLKALAERKQRYGEWLMGEEVLTLRKRYGITQQQASEIFGKGIIAFSRYENETSYPDLSLVRLMGLALADANLMKQLANKVGVDLPLLEKRLTASFLQTLRTDGNSNRVAESLNSTQVQLSSLMAKSAAFLATMRDIAKYPPTVDRVQSQAEIDAANDERFALAA